MNSSAFSMRRLMILWVLTLPILSGCGGSASQPVNNQPLPPAGATILPSSATLTPNGVQQFTAIVNPSGASQAVIWSVSGTGCTEISCGLIDSNGKYTAPASLPTPPTVMVTARSVADQTKSATANVTLTSPPGPNPEDAKLNGQYAFLLSGTEFVTAIGSFTADGAGDITFVTMEITSPGGVAIV